MRRRGQHIRSLKHLVKSFRREDASGELILWKKVLGSRNLYGYQFSRKYAVGDYIVDFICRKLALVVEVEGYSHNFLFRNDLQKDKYLSELGYFVLRFKEKDIVYNLNDVTKTLENYVEKFQEGTFAFYEP